MHAFQCQYNNHGQLETASTSNKESLALNPCTAQYQENFFKEHSKNYSANSFTVI